MTRLMGAFVLVFLLFTSCEEEMGGEGKGVV